MCTCAIGVIQDLFCDSLLQGLLKIVGGQLSELESELDGKSPVSRDDAELDNQNADIKVTYCCSVEFSVLIMSRGNQAVQSSEKGVKTAHDSTFRERVRFGTACMNVQESGFT